MHIFKSFKCKRLVIFITSNFDILYLFKILILVFEVVKNDKDE
jgi:hypothetical protein